MAGSLLGYRVYRLRRLIGVCLGLLALGVALGLWLIPGVTALHITFGVGLFSIIALAHLLMIVIWPQDVAEPLISALGFAVVLAICLPLAHAYLITHTEVIAAVAITLMALPFFWFLGIRSIGWLVLRPLDFIRQRDLVVTSVHALPIAPEAARACFFFASHKKRRNVVTGPVEWDGFITAQTTVRKAGPGEGQVSAEVITSRLKVLEEDALSQGIILHRVAEDGKIERSMVLHQSLSAQGVGTRLQRRFSYELVSLSQRLTGWLGDIEADYVTAMLDDAAGSPPQAICEEPQDSMPKAISRWLRWNEPTPGEK